MRCKLSWVAGPPGRRGGGRAELTTRRGRPFVTRRISGRRVRAVSIVTVDGGSAADHTERAKADACVIQGVHRLVVEVEDQIGPPARPAAVGPDDLPTSNIFFDCDELSRTYKRASSPWRRVPTAVRR
jgi:hypothetical protein